MNLRIIDIQRHRNGICGAPFHAVIFDDPNVGRMLGIVFEAPWHVAVFSLDKLAHDNVRFGENSWRGDQYEGPLRSAIDLVEEMEGCHA